MTEREELEQQLDQLIERLSQNGIKQRTPEWYKDKEKTIGGSSIATIMGLGYKSLRDYIAEKAEERRKKELPPPILTREEKAALIEDRAAMNWGVVFEDVLCTIVEKLYNCRIKGAELYYRDDDKFKHLCYSPDGLGIFDVTSELCMMEVQTEDGVEYVMENLKKPTICLFEFKCPWTRIPSGKPPIYYVPQVKMGLQMLDGPTHGVFAEGVFRRCTMTQLGFGPEFDKTISGRNGTPINRRTSYGEPPLACGILVFTSPQISADIDIGLASAAVFKEILYNAAEGAYEIDYEIFYPGDEIKCITRTLPALILPWKLFRVDVHIIDKDPNYLTKWTPRVDSTIRAIDMVYEEPEKIDQILFDLGL